MAAVASKRASLDSALEALKRVREEPGSESMLSEVKKALGHQHWLVVSEAAELVKTHALSDCAELLRAIWSRFAPHGAKVDPGCRAKEAALTALDHLETLS